MSTLTKDYSVYFKLIYYKIWIFLATLKNNSELYSKFQSSKISYYWNLGNGKEEADVSVAVNAFMRREFPNILDHDKVDHPVLFIPPNFIFNEFTEKVAQG
jgi:hypothetical protein